MSGSKLIWRIAVPAPLRRFFDYLAVENHINAEPGVRVKVPFGRQQLTGVLVEVRHNSPVAINKLRPATQILDAAPILNATDLDLLQWAAQYYQHPPGEVFSAALPPSRAANTREPPVYRITTHGKQASPNPQARRQIQVLDALRLKPDGLTAADLRAQGPVPANVFKTLLEHGWIEITDAAKQCLTQTGPTLTDGQQTALQALLSGVDIFRPTLLHGITGSGKTEVYLRFAEKVLAQGKQVLLLAPEIGLTPQLAARARERLPGQHVVLHSGMADGQRHRGWMAATNSQADVVIGTRSAIFCPMPRLGLIVVDEEHDASFKQQDGFRYHARDVAVRRAQLLNIPVVLGSATPTLESLANVERSRYQKITLDQRTGNSQLAKIHLVHEPNAGRVLSAPSLQAMQQTLAEGRQVLLFLNRRGFSPVMICPECQWQAECRHCDARLVWHRQAGRLRCHHCGHSQPSIETCPDCHTPLVAIGTGTERVEDQVREQFANIPVIRLDRDTTRRRGALEQALTQARQDGPRILIGTQMLAKGHDFPNVGLAVLLNVDSALFSIDFRASERLAQLVIQVAGRAGRGDQPGRVILQTGFIDHPMLQLIAQQNHLSVAKQLMQERLDLALPPYSYQAAIYVDATERQLATDFLDKAMNCLDTPKEVDIFGPLSAIRERIAGRHRWQLLLQSQDRAALHRLLGAWIPRLEAIPTGNKLRWSVDVDPQTSL